MKQSHLSTEETQHKNFKKQLTQRLSRTHVLLKSEEEHKDCIQVKHNTHLCTEETKFKNTRGPTQSKLFWNANDNTAATKYYREPTLAA